MAIVVGYEASTRIIDAMTGFRERGFHGSQAAIFSATVAAARLLHLDVEQMTHAIALTRDLVEADLAKSGRYQRRARIPRRHGDDGQHPGGAGGAAWPTNQKSAFWR